MNRTSSTSIQRQLQLFFVLTLGFTVLVMGAVWIGYNQVLLEKEAERVLIVESDIVGAAARPALMFNDRRLAGELLQSMQFDPEISVVKLFTADGNALYTYVAEDDTATDGEQIAFQATGSSTYVDGGLRLYRVVEHKGAAVGVIVLESRLKHLKQSKYASLVTVIIVMFGVLVLGLVLASRLQKKIAAPISSLAMLMRQMGEERDYSLRADSPVYNRETGALLFGFNRMAEEIQSSFRKIEEQHVNLKQSERRLRDIVELAPVPVIVTSPSDGHVLFYNQASASLMGVERAGDAQFNASDFYHHPEERKMLLKKLHEQGELHGQELEVTSPDGVTSWISLSMSLMSFEGEPAVFSAFVDITAQKNIEQTLARHNQALEQRVVERTAELQAAKNELQSTLDNMLDTYYRLAADGTVQWASASVYSLLGYRLSEIRGVPFEEISVDGQTFARLVETLKQSGGAVINHRGQLRDKQGEEIWVSVSAQLIADDQGKVLGVEGVVRDISQQIQAEEAKQDMEKKVAHVQRLESLGVLAGGIAHDFNNILAGIMGNAELAELNALENMPVSQELRNIVTSSARAADLCKQMLAYSGQGTMSREPLSLSALVEETVQLIDVSISKNISLCFDLCTPLPAIMADKTQMQQIIMNLMTNASEAIGEQDDGEIHVLSGVMQAGRQELDSPYLEEKRPEGEYVFLEVRDSGCGMDAEVLQKMFDPFFTTKFTGRGLGMSATLGIVRSHHGAIQVASAPGQGTTFRILFPVHSEPVCVELAEDEVAVLPASQLTVLVIDDEAMVRAIVEKMLNKLGCNVLLAAGGEEGIRCYRESQAKIDVVLLDMTMPGMGGKETLTKLREIDADIDVIICSGYRNESVSGQFENSPPTAFLQKPFSLKSLQGIVNRVSRGK